MEENWYREYRRQKLLDVYNPSSNMQKLYEDSQHLDKFCNFTAFKSKVENAVKKSLPQENADDAHILLDEICLDIASKNGLTTFVKILLDHGTETNTVNRTYNRAPIHFATESGYVDTLKALLEVPINLNLQDSKQYQTALHIAVNKNYERCAGLLLENGASANIPNSKGLTAIYLAAMNGQGNMVKQILEKHWQFLNLDNYRDQNNQTARELINQNLPELQSMIENLVPIHNYCDLKYYLKVNDELNFLNMQIDKNFSSIAAELLKIATENDLHQAVTRILNWLEEEMEEDDLKRNVVLAAHMAVEKCRHIILRKLIKVVPEIINDLIMEACLQLKELTRSRRSDWLKCMTVMLSQEGVDIRDLEDNESNTPLHYAAKSGYIEAVTLFLNKDCYLGHMNKFNIPPLAYISEDTLKNYFDNCSQMTDERTDECTIEFNYRCLKPYNVSPTDSYDLMKNREMQLFEDLIHGKTHKELIKHPLLSSFLYLKWYKMQYFLLANFVLYMFFYFTLNSYILIMGLNSSVNKNGTQLTNNENSNSTNLMNCTTDNSKSPICQNTYHYILCSIISIWLIFLIFGEILQFVCNCRYYIKDWTNRLQIVLFGLTVAFLCGAGVEIGIAVFLLSIWKLMIMISLYTRFSIGIVMFRTVFYNLVRFFSPYIFLIFGFSMLYHIFYGDSDPNPVFAYIKTIITLASNARVIWDNIISDLRYSTWFRLVLVIFVFLMVIILMNILNGLTLIDSDIWSQAELFELSHRIQLIANFENFACMIGGLMNRYFFKNSSQVFDSFVNRIFLFRNYLKDNEITFWIHDTENFDEESNTPLCHAAESGENISLFRNQDGYISHNKFNVLPLVYIPKGKLAEFFNNCLKMRTARLNELRQRPSRFQDPTVLKVFSNANVDYREDSGSNDYNDNRDYSDNSDFIRATQIVEMLRTDNYEPYTTPLRKRLAGRVS